jgi:serine/threonine protein kinase
LKFIHDHGITHGDIKANNILVFPLDLEMREIVGMERWYIAKLTDFGCAHVNDGTDAQLAGWTPLWAAPEAGTRMKADLIYKTDIYSYGLLVCYVIMDRDLEEIFELNGDRNEQIRSCIE